ncbi:CRISPR system precrRNA processing endoribonuclease RAMP protein Cas6 [Effusibacillus consociatus]|uniref:CRISPR system precrRNA processing endoribonuclease RAMP protein Cas6 n=1 Tax=Effusibacillus consociatus TaxID=1117041 RepID=A0ABV9Q662_9BACL
MFEELRVAKYRFTLQVGERGLELPSFKTAALRGGFGQVFKSLVCTHPAVECEVCPKRNTCAFPYIFMTRSSSEAEIQRKFESIPRPYILREHVDGKTRYKPGETLSFHLLLMGEAIKYFPYFVYTFDRLTESGIGIGRTPVKLLNVEGLEIHSNLSYVLFDGTTRRLSNKSVTFTGETLTEKIKMVDSGQVTIHFETPFRTKWQGRFTNKADFHIVFRSLMRRLSSLLYFHHGVSLNIDFTDLVKKAEAVEIITQDTKWVDLDRYSSRQDSKMSLGGYIGQATYKGDLEPFVPFLLAGELVHASKQAVFGLGQIRCVWW